MKILFMGTPAFAVPSLNALVNSGHEVIGVVTQPDRPKGRGHKLTESPVKIAAKEAGLAVYQPDKVKAPDFIELLKQLAPQLIVVVAFGQILSKEILHLPEYGCINVHASLLPKYRGAAPIHWAVINGEKETGITIMQMNEGLDTGDMLISDGIKISPEDTTGIIHDKLSQLGAELLIKAVEQIENGSAKPVRQDDAKATYAPLLNRETEKINWNNSTEQICNLIRGLNPWPGAYTLLENKVLKIWQAKPCRPENIIGYIDINEPLPPGQVLGRVPGLGFAVAAKNGCIVVSEAQLEGCKRVFGEDLLNGHKVAQGMKLG